MADQEVPGFLEIDGSYGEGGGQVLRTSLSLSAITGQPIRITKIRAGRKKPGLAAQHLTCVRAAASICAASISGDALNSTLLEFTPHGPPSAGAYSFDVGDARAGGSAGSVSLVLQTILLPLAMAEGTSTISLRGGTHVDFSPPLTYLEDVYFPTLRRMGLHVTTSVHTWGWNPKGGGHAEFTFTGNPCLSGLQILERGDLKMVRGIVAVTNLPDNRLIAMVNETKSLLLGLGFDASSTDVKGISCPAVGSGRGIFISAEYGLSVAGFSSLAQGVNASKQACSEMAEFHRCGAPVDKHLGDQLLLPASLAMHQTEYAVSNISLHLTTNAWVIEKFGVAKVKVDESSRTVSVVPTKIANV